MNLHANAKSCRNFASCSLSGGVSYTIGILRFSERAVLGRHRPLPLNRW